MTLADNQSKTAPSNRLDALLDRMSRSFPKAAGFLGWVRKPSSRLVRIPLGILLVAFGFVGFLPILGFWMVPLGLMILALDIRPLQGPVVSAVEWLEEKWTTWRAKRKTRAK